MYNTDSVFQSLRWTLDSCLQKFCCVEIWTHCCLNLDDLPSLSTLWEGKWVTLTIMEVARNNLNIIREFIPQHQPPIPLGTCYMKVPVFSSACLMRLCCQRGCPKRHLRDWKGIWLQNQFPIWRICIWHYVSVWGGGKISNILAFMKTREKLPSLLSNLILSNVCSINVYNLLSGFIYHFSFFPFLIGQYYLD